MISSFTETDLGKSIALQGPTESTSPLLISLALRFQKYGTVLYIDADHTFNPLFVKRRFHKSSKLNLKKVRVARPFTAEQLKSTIDKLHQTIPENAAKAVIISGFDKLFSDPEISLIELPYLVSELIEELTYVTKKHQTFTLLSFSDNQDPRAQIIREEIIAKIHMCCRV